MSRIVDIEPVITKLENTQKQNGHTFSKRELVDAIADIMSLEPIDAVEVVRCKDCEYWICGTITNEDEFIPPKCGKYQQMVGHSANDYCSLGEKVTE